MIVIVLACIGAVYAARRRTEIRKKFGIAGTYMGDICTWIWCPGPALCQEARTLWHNNVHDGVWFGPTQLNVVDALAAQHDAPALNTMSQDV